MQFEALERELIGLSEEFPGRLGLFMHALASGEQVEIDPDGVYPMASVFKLPLLLEVLTQAHAGTIRLSERIGIQGSDLLPGSGVLKELDAGLAPTIKDLATLMTVVSDNVATDALWARVGGTVPLHRRLTSLPVERTRIELSARELLFGSVGVSAAGASPEVLAEVTRRLRSSEFDLESAIFRPETMSGPTNATSPRDMGRLLIGIETRTVADASVCDATLEILSRQQLNDRIPLLLPRSIRVDHKTGTLGTTRNDIGVMYVPAGPVVLVALGRDVDPTQGVDADLIVARAALAVFLAFTQ